VASSRVWAVWSQSCLRSGDYPAGALESGEGDDMKIRWFGGSRKRLWAFAALLPLAAQWADWEVSGFLREEIAVRACGKTNPFNQAGNVFNGKSVPNTGLGPLLAPGLSPETLGRTEHRKKSNTFNMLATRLELSLDGRLTDDLA